MANLCCHACGADVTLDEPIPRDATCEPCGADLRACRNCRHWDPRYTNQCAETEADPVTDRTRRNFCEFFYYSRAPYKPAEDRGERAAAARASLDALFGGKPAAPSAAARPSAARARLEALFKTPPPDDDDASS